MDIEPGGGELRPGTYLQGDIGAGPSNEKL